MYRYHSICEMENAPWPARGLDETYSGSNESQDDSDDKAMARAVSLCDPFQWSRDGYPFVPPAPLCQYPDGCDEKAVENGRCSYPAHRV
jgi:hypothetical protein